MRVQIPPYTDRWMMGDRYGDVVRVVKRTTKRQDLTDDRPIVREIAYVKLDKSGRVTKVLLADCTVVS